MKCTPKVRQTLGGAYQKESCFSFYRICPSLQTQNPPIVYSAYTVAMCKIGSYSSYLCAENG